MDRQSHREEAQKGRRQARSRFFAVLWAMLFLIAMGLGYPTLNRYDPREIPGLYDARAYYAMVVGQPLQEDQADLGHRILVPCLARPIYQLAKGRVHTWDPALFALLTVNALFTATTALLIVLTGLQITGGPGPLLASFLFLADFAVANLNLSAYVDSSVNCLLMAVVWSMTTKRWWLLPALGVLGALAKETFVPIGVVMVFTWWLCDRSEADRRTRRLIWAVAMTIAAFASLTLVMEWVRPAESLFTFAASRRAESGVGFLSGLLGCLTAREFLYTFVWLLPLGALRLRVLPRPWVAAGTAGAFAALAMGAYDDALGNATRAVFSAAGPMLSMATALLLVELATADTTRPSENPKPR